MYLLSLPPRACLRHQLETDLLLCYLSRLPGSYMLPLLSQVMHVAEHHKIHPQQQPSLTEYMPIDLKLSFYHRFYLLPFLIDGWWFLPNPWSLMNDRENTILRTYSPWQLLADTRSLPRTECILYFYDPWTFICTSSIASVPYTF